MYMSTLGEKEDSDICFAVLIGCTVVSVCVNIDVACYKREYVTDYTLQGFIWVSRTAFLFFLKCDSLIV